MLELVASVVSPQQNAWGISKALETREQRLRARRLETSAEMDCGRRGESMKWCMGELMAGPNEQARDEYNRQRGERVQCQYSSPGTLQPGEATPRWELTDIGAPGLRKARLRRVPAGSLAARRTERLCF